MDDKKGGIKTKIQSSQRKRKFRKVTRGNAVKGGIESETRLHALNMMKRYTFFFLYEKFFYKRYEAEIL